MIPTNESSDGDRRDFNAVLDNMVRAGWLTKWGHNGRDIVMFWTAKGRERRTWLKTLDADIDALTPDTLSSAETMTKVRVICTTSEDMDAGPKPPQK